MIVFSFATKLFAFLLFVHICASTKNEKSSLLRCLAGYKDWYDKMKCFFFYLSKLETNFLVTAQFTTVPQIKFCRNVLVVVQKHARIHT